MAVINSKKVNFPTTSIGAYVIPQTPVSKNSPGNASGAALGLASGVKKQNIINLLPNPTNTFFAGTPLATNTAARLDHSNSPQTTTPGARTVLGSATGITAPTAIAAMNANNGNGSAGSASSSSSTATTGGVPSAPNYGADYMSQLSQMLQAQQAQQAATLAAQQQEHQRLVDSAYNANLNSMNDAYGTQVGRLEDTYNSTLGQLEENYNHSADQLNSSADNALREAYINRMMAQKNLTQQLNANGLTGGAAESVIAQLLNNYGNARNNIEVQRGNDLASLLNTYQNNVSSAREQYNDALRQAEAENLRYRTQLENDKLNGIIGTYDALYSALNSGTNTYANAMQGLAASQVGQAADLAATNYRNYLNSLTRGTNTSRSSSSSSSSGAGSVDTSMDASIRNRLAAGESTSALWDELVAGGMSISDARKYLESLGVKF